MAKDVVITDLTGGYNDSDPPTSLAPHQCVSAENVDFWEAPCGARRKGLTSYAGPTSFVTAGVDYITFLYRHFTTSGTQATQLWATGYDTGSEWNLAYKNPNGSWNSVTISDAPSLNAIYNARFVSLHGKLFITLPYLGAEVFHVWDGTSLRRVGLAEPSAAPTSADSGVGSFSGTRYYRVRELVRSGSTDLLLSEPSDVLTDTPSGTGSGITVTKPATTNSNATHWILEASLNNADFYQIATTAIATTTAVDTTAFATGYSAFTLSQDIGDYTRPGTCRHLLVDEDRLLMAGSHTLAAHESTVRWTPVGNEPEGIGNDERIPVDTDNVLVLDSYAGGYITDMVGPINGVIYVFKQNHIYRLIRTGQRNRAYEAVCISKTVGSLYGSAVEGVDETGNPCVYFLDPKAGPCRLGQGGLLTCGTDIDTTWETVNTDSFNTVGGLSIKSFFWPEQKKVMWWVATGASLRPDTLLVLQTNNTRVTENGIRFGWSKWTGTLATAGAVTLYAETESVAGGSEKLVPFVGIGPNIYKMDGTADDDDGDSYTASLVTRPFLVSGSINKNFGIRAGAVIAEANEDAVIEIGLSGDFGKEVSPSVDLSLAPEGAEDPVIAVADDLRISECKIVQVAITDGTGNNGAWALHRIDLIARDEQTA